MDIIKQQSICYLNDDCLLKILNFLPLREQAIFSSLNRRLKNIFYLNLKKKKTYNLYLNYDTWSLEDLYVTFHLIGTITEEFEINRNNEDTNRIHVCLDFVLEYCQNLRILQLQNIHVSHLFNQISKSFRYLESLKLTNCSLTDSNIERLSQLQNIKHLDISKNEKLTGKYIEKFINLEELEMYDCGQVLNDNLVKIFENIKKLRILNLENVYNLDDSAIGALINNCKDLESLNIHIKFHEVEHLKRIPELKKLKKLSINERASYSMAVFEIRNYRNIVNNILENLNEQLVYLKIHFSQADHDNSLNQARFDSIYKLKNLEELHYIGYLSCNVIHWQKLGEYIQNNKKLKTLNITYTNSALGFSSSEFVDFLLHSKNLDVINLTYSSTFGYPRFIYSFIEQLHHRKLSKPIFNLKISGEKSLLNELYGKAEYIAAMDLFNLEAKLIPSYRHTYYGHMDAAEDNDFHQYEVTVRDENNEEDFVKEDKDNPGMKITLNSKLLEI